MGSAEQRINLGGGALGSGNADLNHRASRARSCGGMACPREAIEKELKATQ